MLLSSFFARSMAFTHTPKVQLPFALFSETFLTIRQNSLYVTVCIIARPSYRGYFIHSLSTLHYCNAPSLATRLTGDYRDRTYTGKCSPALLDTRRKKGRMPPGMHPVVRFIVIFCLQHWVYFILFMGEMQGKIISLFRFYQQIFRTSFSTILNRINSGIAFASAFSFIRSSPVAAYATSTPAEKYSFSSFWERISL